MNIIRKLEDFKISLKMHIISSFSIFLFALALIFTIWQTSEYLLEERYNKTRNVVELGISVAKHFHKLEMLHKMTAEEAQKATIETIQNMRFNQDDYLWIQDDHPRMIMHPIKPELNGKDLTNFEDPKHKKLFIEMITVVKNNSAGFVRYMWAKPGSEKPIDKISYVQGFAPWGWIIGSGLYVDDVYKTIFNLAMFIFFIGMIFSLLIYGSNRFLSGFITKPFALNIERLKEMVSGSVLAYFKPSDRLDEIGDFERVIANSSALIHIKSAFENTVNSIIIADENLDFIFKNRAADHMLHELVVHQFLKKMPQSIYQFENSTLNTMFHNKNHASVLMEIGERWFKVSTSPVMRTDGKQIGCVFEWQDITQEHIFQNNLQDVLKAVVSGNLSVRIENRGQTGFFRILSNQLNHLFEVVESSVIHITNALQKLSEGDLKGVLECHSHIQYTGQFGAIQEAVYKTSQDLNRTVTKIIDMANTIDDTIRVLIDDSHQFMHKVEKQVASIEEVSTAIAEITSSVSDTADHVQQVRNLVLHSQDDADNGLLMSENAIVSVRELQKFSEQIIKIIHFLDDISAQTNLLALNASIEAARAGDVGKGFGVVAEKVSMLAQRSTESAKQIKMILKENSRHIRLGVDVVQKAGESIHNIAEGFLSVEQLVSSATEAMDIQSKNMKHISVSVTSIDQLTQQNTDLISQNLNGIEHLYTQASLLKKMMSVFKT